MYFTRDNRPRQAPICTKLWYNCFFMSDPRRKRVMETANSLIDKPAALYRGPEYGKTPDEPFDCSGFVTYALNASGIHIPDFIGHDGKMRPVRHANDYWDHYGVHVHDEQSTMGDLVFFSRNGLFPTHMGILTYHDTYIHANVDKGIVEEAPLVLESIEASGDTRGRQLYIRNPIGYKALTVVAKEPTYRYHQALLD